jgi:tetrahydromethanopterin S-methyltransferase subunit E
MRKLIDQTANEAQVDLRPSLNLTHRIHNAAKAGERRTDIVFYYLIQYAFE